MMFYVADCDLLLFPKGLKDYAARIFQVKSLLSPIFVVSSPTLPCLISTHEINAWKTAQYM